MSQRKKGISKDRMRDRWRWWLRAGVIDPASKTAQSWHPYIFITEECLCFGQPGWFGKGWTDWICWRGWSWISDPLLGFLTFLELCSDSEVNAFLCRPGHSAPKGWPFPPKREPQEVQPRDAQPWRYVFMACSVHKTGGTGSMFEGRNFWETMCLGQESL